jgi:hypothetical protein
MTVDGVIATFSTRLDGTFQTAATPPTTRQLTNSVHTRPSAEFQQTFAASKFTPNPAKTVDLLA